jgi:putative membrane-bound dehydrogenase-like protein
MDLGSTIAPKSGHNDRELPATRPHEEEPHMMFIRIHRVIPFLLVFVFECATSTLAALPKVPEGFEIRLVASVPAVLYPCQIATAPGGALFVAEDPMDQVGPHEASHGRILLFRPNKEPVVFGDGFRAIFGMAWHDGALFVCHTPFLSVLRDVDGDGKSDQRKELFVDLGPNNQGLNDHLVSGIQFGMDGYIYISVGDKGIPKASGPDGRTVRLMGGGILRCRPDGTRLQVVSTGTRNHLEPNLDARDNLFTYDNTDDGIGWWTRVTHHVDGGYYGYPYDYRNRPDLMLPRMAEYGAGAPCGGVLYKEDAWPDEYRGVAFWAEWGKGKVQAFRFAPKGATFNVVEAIDFVVPNGVENFRPIDLALSYDGETLYVADWGMGGWGSTTDKVGRVYAITHRGNLKTRPRASDSDPIATQIQQLEHPSFNERMRAQWTLIKQGHAASPSVTSALASSQTKPLAKRHLVWAVNEIAGGTTEGRAALVAALEDPEPDVRAQSARALGLRADWGAEEALRARMADSDAIVRLQANIALGRIGKPRATPGLLQALSEKDEFLRFSARVALRRIGDWNMAAHGLDSTDPQVRAGTLAALELVYEPDAVSVLARYVSDSARPASERATALSCLARVHRKAKPWDGRWWGTRPADGAPPAKVDAWQATPLISEMIRRGVADRAGAVRLAAADAVKETGDRELLAALRQQLVAEPDNAVRVAIIRSLGTMGDKAALPILVSVFRDPDAAGSVIEAALASIERIGSDQAVGALVALLDGAELDAGRRVRAIGVLGRLKGRAAVGLLVRALKRPEPELRAAAAEALGKIGQLEGVSRPLWALLGDTSTDVKKAAITALGALADREAISMLLAAASVDETRFDAIRAMAAMPDVLALQAYLCGLADKSPDLRKASFDALVQIRSEAAPILVQLADRHELSSALIPELRKVYTSVQPVTDWQLLGAFKSRAEPPFAIDGPIDLRRSYKGVKGEPVSWKHVTSSVEDHGLIDLNAVYPDLEDPVAFGYVDISSPADRAVQLAVGSNDTLTVWLNGKQVYNFPRPRGYEPAMDRFDVKLIKGINRLVIRCGNLGGPWQFAVGFGSRSDYTFLNVSSSEAFSAEAFRTFALKTRGNVERGRSLFHDLKGLACIKCHVADGRGGRIGPDLSSVGVKYPRDELIGSILFPSARISSGYEPVVVATDDGRVFTGIIKSDQQEAIEIEDVDAKRIRIPTSEISDRRKSSVSLMPTGLTAGLTKADFADLIAYLETLKDTPSGPHSGDGRR